MALGEPEIADPPVDVLFPAQLPQQTTHDPLFLNASMPNGSSHRVSLRVRPPLPHAFLDNADPISIPLGSSSSAPSIPSPNSPGSITMPLRDLFARRKGDTASSAVDSISVRSHTNVAPLEGRPSSAGAPQNRAFPLVQAWSQAVKQSTLEVANLGQSTRVLSRSKSRKSATTPKSPKTGSGDKVREGFTSSITQAVKLTAKLGAQGPRKVIILTTCGYLLQYAEDGDSDRSPEKFLQLSPESVAFASDTLPGRHYVIRVAQSAEQIDLNSSRPFLARFTRSTPPIKQDVLEMLLIMPDPLEMEAWLSTIRQVIQNVRSQSFSRSSTIHDSSEGDRGEASVLAKTPSQSHRYQVKRDPTKVAVLLSPSGSLRSAATYAQDAPVTTDRSRPLLTSVSSPTLALDRHRIDRMSIATASTGSSDGVTDSAPAGRHMSMTTLEGTSARTRAEFNSASHGHLRMEKRIDKTERHDSKIFSLPEGQEVIQQLNLDQHAAGGTFSTPEADATRAQPPQVRSPVLLPNAGTNPTPQRRQSQPFPVPLALKNGPTRSRVTRNSTISPSPTMNDVSGEASIAQVRNSGAMEDQIAAQQPQRSKGIPTQSQLSPIPQPGDRASSMGSATISPLIQAGALSKRPTSMQVRTSQASFLVSIRHPAQSSTSLVEGQKYRGLRASRSLTTLKSAGPRERPEPIQQSASRLAVVQESDSTDGTSFLPIPPRRLPRVQSQIQHVRTIKPRASLPELDFGIPLIGLGPPSAPPNMPLPPPPPTIKTPLSQKIHLPRKAGERPALPMPPSPPPTAPLPAIPLPSPEAVLAGNI